MKRAVVPRRLPGMRALLLALLALALLAPAAQAQVARAWLDRGSIAVDETATLNIEVTGVATGSPDYSPLLRDFQLSGYSSTRSYQQVNGASQVRTLYGVALQPRREGTLPVPALEVAGLRTPPLSLTVTATAARPAGAGDVAFIESGVDASTPYVQQATGYVVRLYVGVPLVSGELDQPQPDGATLQRVGDDVRYSREIDGRRYTVIERHYLLLPERSGVLEVPGARFRGRGVAGFFDDLFGDGDLLEASGATLRLQVRGIPDRAPQPWLPLHDLSLRWAAKPGQVRAGEAATVIVEASADGATAAQLPELQLPPIDGAQVFADPVQVDESFVDGRPRATARRTFSIVPARAGTLRIEGPRLSWWDVRAGRAAASSLPTLDLVVVPGTQTTAPIPGGGVADRPREATAGDGDVRWRVPGVLEPVRPWAFATVLFALAWLLTLAWGLHRRPPGKAMSATANEPRTPPATSESSLRRALRAGDLADIGDALCASAQPPAAGLEPLLRRLSDPAQREAIELLQRARWSDGDPVAAREALRAAFREGPRWRHDPAYAREPLPPLYP